MKKLLVGLLAGSFLLGGCTTMQGPSVQTATDDTDYGKIAAVEHWAKQRGVLVVWVTKPTKKS